MEVNSLLPLYTPQYKNNLSLFRIFTKAISRNFLRYFRFIYVQLCYYIYMKRCEWANRSELEQSYHDKEWQ